MKEGGPHTTLGSLTEPERQVWPGGCQAKVSAFQSTEPLTALRSRSSLGTCTLVALKCVILRMGSCDIPTKEFSLIASRIHHACAVPSLLICMCLNPAAGCRDKYQGVNEWPVESAELCGSERAYCALESTELSGSLRAYSVPDCGSSLSHYLGRSR